MTDDALKAFRTWLAARPSLSTTTIYPTAPPDGENVPDRCIGLKPYSGPEVPNWQADYRCQIICRSALPGVGVSPEVDALALAAVAGNAVAPAQDTLLVASLVIGGVTRRAILRKVSGPIDMGPDSKGRHRQSINVALQMARV